MIHNRIQMLIDTYCEGNKTEFAKSVGVTLSVITNITGQRKGMPSFEVLKKIAIAYPFVNYNWLLTGRGEMLIKEPDIDMLRRVVEAQDEIIELQKKNAELLAMLDKFKSETNKNTVKAPYSVKRE